MVPKILYYFFLILSRELIKKLNILITICLYFLDCGIINNIDEISHWRLKYV